RRSRRSRRTVARRSRATRFRSGSGPSTASFDRRRASPTTGGRSGRRPRRGTDVANDVYTLTIAGPGKNSLSSAVMQDVIRQVREAKGRPVLVVGEGDAFSAGLNLKEVASLDAAGME